jgi:cation transport regulator ChaB
MYQSNSDMPDKVKQVLVRWESLGGEAAFRHLHDNDLVIQYRRKNADRKK